MKLDWHVRHIQKVGLLVCAKEPAIISRRLTSPGSQRRFISTLLEMLAERIEELEAELEKINDRAAHVAAMQELD